MTMWLAKHTPYPSPKPLQPGVIMQYADVLLAIKEVTFRAALITNSREQ